MKIIKLVVIVIFSVLFLVGLSGCTNPYTAVIHLINNYTEKVHLALGKDNDFIVKEGTDFVLNESKGYYFIKDVATKSDVSDILLLSHDVYSIEDWIVFYDVDGQTEKEHTVISDINDNYEFKFLRTYKITIDENKNVTLEVVEPTN